MKHIGNFIYEIYPSDGTIAVAYKALLSNEAGKMIVSQKFRNILVSTGAYRNFYYSGCIYTGIVYENTISEDRLISLLHSK